MSLNASNFGSLPRFKDLTDVRVVVKAADETVNNSNVLQDDDELHFHVLSGGTYYFRLYVRTIQDDAAADWIETLTAPGGSTGGWRTGAPTGNNNVNDFGVSVSFTNTVTIECPVTIEGVIVAGADGVVQYQWAQAAATVADNKVLAGSFLIAMRLA